MEREQGEERESAQVDGERERWRGERNLKERGGGGERREGEGGDALLKR